MIDEAQATQLLNEYVTSDSLKRHCKCVEVAMKFYARQRNQSEADWGIVGLLHDFDYEKFPETHPREGMKILENLNCPTEWINAIGSHNQALGIPIETPLEKYLFACDELSGFITAVTFVRPSKSILEVEPRSVLKKLRTASFAANVSRDDVYEGAKLIGIELQDHVSNLLTAFCDQADYLELRGNYVPA